MKRLSSILLVAAIFSGCGTTEEEVSNDFDSMNSEQENMIKEVRQGGNQEEEKNYNENIADYFKKQEGPITGVDDEN